MRGIAEFNFPAFRTYAARLRAEGHEVFSPAEKAEDLWGPGLSAGNEGGDNARAEREHSFSLREALACDLDWICRRADAIALMPGWGASKGACAERAAAIALGLGVMELAP